MKMIIKMAIIITKTVMAIKVITMRVIPRRCCKIHRVTLASFLKRRLWHRYFPVNFSTFLRTPFLTEHIQWLLLDAIQF